MKRGEIWTTSGASDYAGKPRPWLIVQSDRFAVEASAILCGFTTVITKGERLRPLIMPSPENGLERPSRVMVDKIASVAFSKLGKQIGVLSGDDLARVETALLLVLGFGE